jgi:cytochrome c biogenesis protein CcmG/thiol:disulfide interchange protein DsbE
VNRFAIPLAVFAALVVLFAVALKRAPEKGVIPSALIGKPAPEFTLPDLLKPGETVDSTAFDGRWRLAVVWATWCAPCYTEHPLLMDIAREGKVTLLGINYNDTDDKARQFLAELGNPYAAVGVDRKGQTSMDFGVYGAPESYLISADNTIVYKVVGGITAKEWQEKMLPLIDGAAQ